MARPRTIGLTHRQGEALQWVKKFIQRHNLPPTLREIGAGLGIKSPSVLDLLKALERKGFLKRGKLGARSLILEDQDHEAGPQCEELQIVGLIPAGRPIEALENPIGTLTVGKTLSRGRSFALQVVGNSMVDAGILDGDCVIIRKQPTAENGDIVVALIEDEATLKRFYREGRRVRLEPANQKMKPIHVSAGEFKIQGKVVGIMRFMGGSGPRMPAAQGHR